MADALNPSQLATVVAVATTLLPPLDAPEGAEPGLAAYFRDGAAERGIDITVASIVPLLDAPVRSAVMALVAHLEAEGFADLGLEDRVAALHRAADDQHLRLGVRHLKTLVLGTFVNGVGPDRRNPTWPVLGYPGPVSAPIAPSDAPGRLPVLDPEESRISADVVIIGSGAGGAVIAARCAAAGLSVLVLEAGEERAEDSLKELDSDGAGMFLRGGILWSENGQMGVLAGAVLGGGTLINSMVCLKTPDDVRADWASQGLTGLDGPEFDKHLDQVWDRLGVNTDATVYNGNTRAMITGLASLGYGHERLPRNAARDDDSSLCGYCNAGCQRGAKRTVVHTYLQDAVAAGTSIIVGCEVDAVLSEDGVASGVRATLRRPDGDRQLIVDAPSVVVAAGGIESPAVLLRSGIGGPAVGRNLRLHPAWIVTGVYEEPIEAWHGQIQSAVSFDLTKVVDGGGFLVESLGLNPGTWAGQMPFVDGRTTRERLLDLRRFATWHGVSHDHGSGEVYLDDEGRAAVRWELDDADRKIGLRAHRELAAMHRAAGAAEVFTFHWKDVRWRKGEDFDAFVDSLGDIDDEDYTAYSAHQMGSCRLGDDPETSVADGWGQLHDVSGVWVGDASALPAAPGVNPMITIMALAERTAEALIQSRGL